MPEVAQFTPPTPGSRPPVSQLQSGLPPVVQYQLPQSNQPPQLQISSTEAGSYLPLGMRMGTADAPTPQDAKDTFTGIGKGIYSTLKSADVLDTMNKMAGATTDWAGMTEQQQQQIAAPQNPTQASASIGTQLGAGLAVPGEVNAGREASQLAAVPGVTKTLASAKSTLGTVAKGLMSLGENPQTARDAKAIEPLVANKVLKAGEDAKTVKSNVTALKNEIANSATGLESELKGMEIKPTIQPEELNGIFEKQLASIEKNVPPSGQAAAKTTAQWIWQKFINNLPKGRELLPEDVLSARKATDEEIESIKGQNVFDPATENGFSTALRSYRQGANDLLETKAPGSKAALSYQSSLYNVLENLSQKGAGAVKKADEIANLPGIKGLVARHPYAAGAAGLAGTALLEGAGLAGAAKLFGVYPSSNH